MASFSNGFILFKDMAIDPRVFFTVLYNGNIPGPQICNQLSVLFFGVVKFGERIALPVRGNVKGSKVILAADHECSSDDRVAVPAIHRSSTEEVFAGAL
jgi:hypothetical protein